MTPLRLRDRVRRLPAGDLLVKTVVFLIGLAFIVTGLALAVLPGPFTIPPILVGLLIWALEFEFAQRWADSARDKAVEAWDAAKEHPWRTAAVTAAGLGLALAAAVAASRWGLVDHARGVLT